jgi:L-seryl-tRNA(Ser) seleniumtransferase
VHSLLESPELTPIAERYGRALVTEAARRAVEAARTRIQETGKPETVTAFDVARTVEHLNTRSLRRVINGTGVVLHTNLGRAPLAPTAQEALLDVARGYSSVELEIDSGERGDRHAHVSALIAQLLETEGGLAFNNNAAAMMVMLAALCRGKEVIVARGELVEIGGGFRVPDVMKESGATLVEVGTTNKVYDRDYIAAITERTGAILRVHRSNFAIVGFTDEPDTRALARLAFDRGLPFLVDIGSGLLASDEALGEVAPMVNTEPRPLDVLRQGADLVAFSGDKLLGGPQAGIVAGRTSLLEKLKRHPLARAIRADKLTLAALEATLRLYRDGRAAEIPVIRQLCLDSAELTQRAEKLASVLQEASRARVDVRDDHSVVGGGSLPLSKLPTKVVMVGEPGEEARRLAQALRDSEPPLITRFVDDRVALDVRTIGDDEMMLIAPLVERAYGRNKLMMRESKEATP